MLGASALLGAPALKTADPGTFPKFGSDIPGFSRGGIVGGSKLGCLALLGFGPGLFLGASGSFGFRGARFFFSPTGGVLVPSAGDWLPLNWLKAG